MVTLRHLCLGPEPAKDTQQVERPGESTSEVPQAAHQEISVLALLYLWSRVACVCVIFSTLKPAPFRLIVLSMVFILFRLPETTGNYPQLLSQGVHVTGEGHTKEQWTHSDPSCSLREE